MRRACRVFCCINCANASVLWIDYATGHDWTFVFAPLVVTIVTAVQIAAYRQFYMNGE